MPFLDRFGLLASIVLVVGSVAFRLLVIPRARLSAGLAEWTSGAAAKVGLVAALALLPMVALRLVVQVNSFRVAGDPWAPIANTLLHETTWGRTWYVQLAAAIVAAAAFSGAVRRKRGAWGWAAFAAILLAATPAFSGHAISSEEARAFLLPADVLHVVGAGTWIGTLAVVLLAGVLPMSSPSANATRGDIVSLINSFSPVAQASAAVVVLSGLLAAWNHLGGVGAVFESVYGRVLLAKIAVVAVVAALGFINWKRVTPRTATEGPAPLVRSATREIVAAIVVLLLTAALIASPQPTTQ